METKGIPNLAGDRDIEYTWITSRINESVGTALDFGSGDSSLGLFAARKGYDVTAVDLQRISWPYEHKGLRFLRGDLLKLPLPKKHFDLIINCSAIEHAGIAGRYGVEEHSENADLEIMGRMKALMKPGGVMLLTIPVGRDQVFIPNCRIYGEERLSRLLKGFQVEEEEYWVKNSENRWVQSNKETALRFQAEASSLDPLKNVYALGCFLLRPNEE